MYAGTKEQNMCCGQSRPSGVGILGHEAVPTKIMTTDMADMSVL